MEKVGSPDRSVMRARKVHGDVLAWVSGNHRYTYNQHGYTPTYSQESNFAVQCMTMNPEYATVKAKGQVVIPVDVRRKFQIEEGTRVAFLEEDGRLVLQPVTDEFIDNMQGVLAGRRLPDRIARDADRDLR